jgi:hypothetical protein
MFIRSSKSEKLQLRLQGALTYVLRSCTLGANNKINDIINSDFWVMFQRWRYDQIGHYRKPSQHTMTNYDKEISRLFNGGSLFAPKKEELISLSFISSSLNIKDLPNNKSYVVIQEHPGTIPSELYILDRSKKKVLIKQLNFVNTKDMLSLTTALYPSVTNHVYTDIAELTKKQLRIISSLTGYNEQWYYHATHAAKINAHKKKYYVHCRLDKEKSFLLSSDWAEYLANNLLTLAKRQANCGDRSHLLTQYLWEHSEGINRIEYAEIATFDHSLVIINRDFFSNLHDSDTWGSGCWVIDTWYGEQGLIFPGIEFKNKIKLIKDFAILQDDELNKIGLESLVPIDKNTKESLKEIQYEIIPSKDPYPSSHIVPFQSVEYYYTIGNAYTEELVSKKGFNSLLEQSNQKHKENFKPCLEEISSKNRMR